MPESTIQTENLIRIFRDNPFAWYDKEVMRYLRGKYGKDKKKFLIIRAVYTALTEIESDFKTSPINFFTKTVGTYAGVSREVAGKYLNMLEDEGLIKKTRERDPKTRKFIPGTTIRILSLKSIEEPSVKKTEIPQENKPVSGYPSNGLPQRWDTPASNKNISTPKEIKINVNENLNPFEYKKRLGMQGLSDILKQIDGVKHKPDLTQKKKPVITGKQKPEEKMKRDYYAEQLATELQDQKSLGCYRAIVDKVPQMVIYETLASVKETWKEGKIKKSRGALFVDIIKTYCEKKNIQLHFQVT